MNILLYLGLGLIAAGLAVGGTPGRVLYVIAALAFAIAVAAVLLGLLT